MVGAIGIHVIDTGWTFTEGVKQSMYHFVELMGISKTHGKLPLSRYLKNSSGPCRGTLGNKNVIEVRFWYLTAHEGENILAIFISSLIMG